MQDQLVELSGKANSPRKDRTLAATAQLLWRQMEQIMVPLADAEDCEDEAIEMCCSCVACWKIKESWRQTMT